MTIAIRIQTHGEDCKASYRVNSEEPQTIGKEDGVALSLGNIGDTVTITYERNVGAPPEQEDTDDDAEDAEDSGE